MTTMTTPNIWQERFEKEFVYSLRDDRGRNVLFKENAFRIMTPKLERNLKAFIASAISLAVQEERKRVIEEVLKIVNNESAIDGQYLEPSQTRKHERNRITESIQALKTNQKIA